MGGQDPAAERAAGSSWDWLVKYAVPAVPVAGLLVYGLLRQLYAIFYGSLGASPEEVGLGYSEILALSAIGVVWVPLLAAASFAIVALLVKLPGTPSRAVLMDHLPRTVTAGAGVATVVVGVLADFGVLPGHNATRVILTTAGVVLLLLAWLWPLKPPVPSRDRPLAVALFVLYSVFLSGAVLQGYAHSDADLAYQGMAVRSVDILGIQVLGLRAEPAVVSWRDKVPPGLGYTTRHCMMYLGESNDTAVFFDPGPRYLRTLRLKTSDVIVTVVRDLRGPVGTVACHNTAATDAGSDPTPPGVEFHR